MGTTTNGTSRLESPSIATPAAGRIRVLLVEPRSIYAARLTKHLGDQMFAVDVAPSESDALEALLTADPDVMLVCIGSHQRGVEMFDRLRAVCAPHVIAVTDDDIAPTIRGLTSRIRDALRHRLADDDAARETHRRVASHRAFGDLEVDLATRRVLLCGHPVSLTRTEFQILALLLDRPGEVITRRHLEEQLWGLSWVGNRHTVGVHIGHLRRKLGDDPGAPRYVLTVRGVGYRLDC
jgi:DNA-binding response OmpR family regulator